MSGNKKNIKNKGQTKVTKKLSSNKISKNSSKLLTKKPKTLNIKIASNNDLKIKSANLNPIKNKIITRNNKKIIKIASKKKAIDNLTSSSVNSQKTVNNKNKTDNVVNFIDWSKVNVYKGNELVNLKDNSELNITKINASSNKSLFKKLKNNHLISNSDGCALNYAKKKELKDICLIEELILLIAIIFTMFQSKKIFLYPEHRLTKPSTKLKN